MLTFAKIGSLFAKSVANTATEPQTPLSKKPPTYLILRCTVQPVPSIGHSEEDEK